MTLPRCHPAPWCRSESMLEQARQSMQADPSLQKGEYLLLRADVGRLPFPTGSVAAIHAGAAIHCWPNPQGKLGRGLGKVAGLTHLGGAASAGNQLCFRAVAPHHARGSQVMVSFCSPFPTLQLRSQRSAVCCARVACLCRRPSCGSLLGWALCWGTTLCGRWVSWSLCQVRRGP